MFHQSQFWVLQRDPEKQVLVNMRIPEQNNFELLEQHLSPLSKDRARDAHGIPTFVSYKPSNPYYVLLYCKYLKSLEIGLEV